MDDLDDVTGPSLDDEGIPDLEGPLPEKSATGDPQEGLSPPADRPASLDYGVTEEEQRRREPLTDRLAREQPDVGDDAVHADDPAVRLLDEASTEGLGDEGDVKDLVGAAEDVDTGGLGAEDAAVHVRDDAPGAVEGPDSYLPPAEPPAPPEE